MNRNNDEEKSSRHRIEDLGRLRERLAAILEDEWFDSPMLSKHNEEWDLKVDNSFCLSLQEYERVNELLDNCRRRFCCYQDKLYDCLSIAKGDE